MTNPLCTLHSVHSVHCTLHSAQCTRQLIFFSLKRRHYYYVGDVVYAALPDAGQQVTADAECGALGNRYSYLEGKKIFR